MDTNELPDRDPLTGLLARGVWLRLIAERTRPAAVVLVDLDDVSALNDRFGYEPVDEALIEIAARLDRLSAGAAARLGGDEFLLVLATPFGDIEPEATSTRVERLISDEPVRVRSGVGSMSRRRSSRRRWRRVQIR